MFDIGEVHRARYGRVKRLFDLAVAIVGLVALVVAVPIVLVGDLVANRGSLLYRQDRVGKNGATFRILKFRTMRPDVDAVSTEWTSENDIRIVYTGLRPGEKLFEELLADDEHTRPTPHPKLRIAKARDVHSGWLEGLLEWLHTDRIPSDSEVRRDLKRWVPEYQSQVRPRLISVTATRAAGGAA